MQQFLCSFGLHSKLSSIGEIQSSGGSSTDTLPTGWERCPIQGLYVLEAGEYSKSGICVQPMKVLTHAAVNLRNPGPAGHPVPVRTLLPQISPVA